MGAPFLGCFVMFLFFFLFIVHSVLVFFFSILLFFFLFFCCLVIRFVLEIGLISLVHLSSTFFLLQKLNTK